MQSNGISVVECELKSNPSLCMEKGRIVGYDRRKFENEAECCTALIHEDGHFESGAFYKPFSVYQVKQQAENKAWRSAFRKRIPWCELKGEILKGFSISHGYFTKNPHNQLVTMDNCPDQNHKV